jgi:BON domain
LRSTPHYLSIAAVLCAASLSPTFRAVAQGAAVSDAQIVANVTTTLANEQALAGQTITPTALHGVVTLSGSVTSDAAKVLASSETGQVAGVKTVLNNLTVSGGSSATPPPRQSATSTRPIDLPPGTLLPVRLNDEVTTRTAKPDDTFTGNVINNVFQNGMIVIPAGTPVLGRVVVTKPAPKMFGYPALSIELIAIQLPTTEAPVNLRLASDQLATSGPGSQSRTTESPIPAGASGIAIGNGNGIRTPQNIILPPNTLLRFHTTQPLTVTVFLRNAIQLPLSPAPGPAMMPPPPTASLSSPH